MKVLLINGSPHERGCTYTALRIVADALEEGGVETEIFHVGTEPIRGCLGCGGCARRGNHQCVFDGDTVNKALCKAATADGFVFGSPVHYGAASGMMTSFLDRFFYAGGSFLYKPAAAVVSCRRAGSTAALDQLNKYITFAGMPMITSHYWNMVHGSTPEQVMQDLEGVQIMRVLGKNMAWLLHCISFSAQNGILPPEPEQRVCTNFIR